ncbi:MAG: hypothetical protein HKN25_15835 [Pyrinomonadaceae bacterium]|nr:hypothetical protein [Pyrinomonadaceae bacterium]
MNKLILVVLATLIFGGLVHSQTGTIDTKTSTARKKRGPVFRATKEQVIQVQTMLKEKGSYTGELDGKFNSDFRNAIKSFQAGSSLRKTGTLNRATLEKMGVELTERQKSYPVNPRSFDTSKNDASSKPRRRSFRVNKEQITRAQTILLEKGLFNGEVNGKYSKDLRSSIKDFQSANGLKRKGSLNRATVEKMGIELTDTQKEIPVNPKDLAKGDDGSPKPRRKIFRAGTDQIRQVQAMLKTKGLYKGEETGKLNSSTRAAIREWQTNNNVKKTGTLNKATLKAMGIELTEKQKAF